MTGPFVDIERSRGLPQELPGSSVIGEAYLLFCDPLRDHDLWGGGMEPCSSLSLRFLNFGLRRLKTGFRHVQLLYPLGEGHWCWINPHSAALDCLAFSKTQCPKAMKAARWNLWSLVVQGRVRLLKVPIERQGKWRLRPVPSCVATVAHALGLNFAMGFRTPHGLYRALLSSGQAQPVKSIDEIPS